MFLPASFQSPLSEQQHTSCIIGGICQKYDFCRDKQTLSRLYVCRDKHTFVVTKDVFCRDKHVFVGQKSYLWQLPPMIVCSTLSDLSRHWKEAHPERGLNLRPERLLETERNPTVQYLGSR